MSSERRNATSSPAIALPLKWHIDGGKAYLAKKIVALMPPRCRKPNAPAADDPGWLHYVEPYAGGLAVLLANDPEGISEVVNDLCGNLTIFWRVLASESIFPEFLRLTQATPFSEAEWGVESEGERRHGSETPYVTAAGTALRFFIRCRQSLAGRMKGFTGITKTRTRRGMNNEVSAWLSAVEGLPAVHERLKRVLIVGPKPAVEVIRSQDGPRTLFYLDPPYLHETRATTGEYAHEMTYAQHRELLEVMKSIKGKFLLSGYDSDLYRGYSQTAPRWNRHDFEIANHAAGGKDKRRMTESVWTNF